MGDEFVFPLFIALAVAVRFVMHFWDVARIRTAAEVRGWSSISIGWAPFSPGWFFEKGERHYLVRYQTEDGGTSEAYCKTSLFTGVYWRDETV